MAEITDFKHMLQDQLNKFSENCKFWENEQKSNREIPDDVRDLIRLATGKTQLLIRGKLRQFNGLIDAYENNSEGKAVTQADLQGYWDLVSIEITDINCMFMKLDKIRSDEWADIQEASIITLASQHRPQLKSKLSKSAVSKTSNSHSLAARKRLAEIKKQMRDSQNFKADEKNTTLFEVPAFFSVRSPIKGKKEITTPGKSDKRDEVPPMKPANVAAKARTPVILVSRESKRNVNS